MKWSKTSIAALTAASIDCDGSISIVKHKPDERKNPNYYVMISLQQMDGRLVDFLFGCWGGRVSREGFYGGTYPTDRTYTWKWKIKDDKAEILLKRCYKYMLIKKEKALNALRFITFKKKNRSINQGSRGYSDFVWDKYEEFWLKSKEFTRDFKDSKAGIETERQKRQNDVSDSPNL